MDIPAPPPEDQWQFIDDLKTPLHRRIVWQRTESRADEANLSEGVALDWRFPDPDGRLATARADFARFLRAGELATDGPYRISVEQVETEQFETYRLDVEERGCRLQAGDTEGIRRGLVFLEDEILGTGGPFLACGVREREPLIRTRISRCFFGPIKRPPRNRDELADEVDYYPDEYLNRLAHEGTNGLWLTISFRDLCPSDLFSEHGADRERRLEKLRRTVEQCARYGIRIYLFCIEPWGFGQREEYLLPRSALEVHPDLGGHRTGDMVYFCTSTTKGKRYLEECTYFLFSEVPGLGGMIDINMGERPTHCYSDTGNFFRNNCPRCSRRPPEEVFADTVSTLAGGMRRASREAEYIAWLYVPYITEEDGFSVEEKMAVCRRIAARISPEVTLQYNFESMGRVEQLGRERVALDYWLAWPGPSEIFAQIAQNATAAGARVAAKIQVGCSHEVATIPFVPVPGILYKKYRAMHELGVSSVMQCWYFGNYPGIMNRAAGELSFAPFPEEEEAFLRRLAAPLWKEHAGKVVAAWRLFEKGYSSFPINLSFTWYGPLHHSVVWPLHLVPVDRPIAPSWKFTFPLVSGDRIGECICYDHTFEEVMTLLEEMTAHWNAGLEIFEGLAPRFKDDPERLLDIGLAGALGLQIESARNAFRFYYLREELPRLGKEEQVEGLDEMRELVRREIENGHRLKELCRGDSRLGFHSEAEGYKYFPALLDWRKERLEELLRTEFPRVEASVQRGELLFPEYTGEEPEGKTYLCRRGADDARWERLERSDSAVWRAFRDDDDLHVTVRAPIGSDGRGKPVSFELEPKRLWPALTYGVDANGSGYCRNFGTRAETDWGGGTVCEDGMQETSIDVSLASLRSRGMSDRCRVNVTCGEACWVPKEPFEARLRFGTHNPANLGWLFFG